MPKWMTPLGAAVTLALSAMVAAAQDGPSFDCARAQSSAEELVCGDPELAALDRRVAERYAAALSATAAFADAAPAERTLRATQRGWIKGWDDCWKADDPRTCVETAYLIREGELVALYMLEKPVGIATWQCDGNPANEIVTYFYETELPSARFERGDTIDAAHQTRTASGARYEGSFGRWIWMKGNEATVDWPPDEGMSCRIAEPS